MQGQEYLQAEIITSHYYEGIGGKRVDGHQLASSRTHSWPVINSMFLHSLSLSAELIHSLINLVFVTVCGILFGACIKVKTVLPKGFGPFRWEPNQIIRT